MGESSKRMPRTKKRDLQRRISQAIRERNPTDTIEKHIADCLLEQGQCAIRIEIDDLLPIFTKIAYVMIGQQKIAGLDVPVVRNVIRMNITVAQCEAKVDCEVHIHSPIVAFIGFKYTLVNDGNGGLRLKNNKVKISQKTRRFDIFAKTALAALNVEKLARRELNHLDEVIRNTLPEQLEQHGYSGGIADIVMELMPDDTLQTIMIADAFDDEHLGAAD